MRDARDAHEVGGEVDDIARKVEPAGHAATVRDVTTSRSACALGVATMAGDTVLDAWFPAPVLGTTAADVPGIGSAIDSDEIRGVVTRTVTVTVDDLDAPPADALDAYLRLHLLSHRLAAPRSLNLDGIFGLLTNVAWSSIGPIPVDRVGETRLRSRAKGHHVVVYGVDKFPRMVEYVIPSGVRIADADRVRLGAHLAEGTTVMHEGFVNFNAGTLGTSMVEGRISAGVVVGDGSDIGGGASIMGTLSGGGTEQVTIGERCLIGANAGVGISLGDGCVVEAGLYITAGTKVALPDGTVAKGRELSGARDLLYRRNSQTGAVEAVARTGSWGGLNAALHAN